LRDGGATLTSMCKRLGIICRNSSEYLVGSKSAVARFSPLCRRSGILEASGSKSYHAWRARKDTLVKADDSVHISNNRHPKLNMSAL
jgi:hypothetical protein